MTEQVIPRPQPAARGTPARWLSSRRAQSAVFVVAALLVETLPVQAWLLMFAVLNNASVVDAAAPLWFFFGVALLAWWIGRLFYRQSWRIVLAASVTPFLFVYLILLRISPTAYLSSSTGPFDVSWLGALARDGLGASNGPLLLLLLYLWWRGLSHGARPLSYKRVSRPFIWGFVAIIMAGVALVTVSASLRGAAGGALSLLLPAQVFCGLLTLALARIFLQGDSPTVDPTYMASEGIWLTTGIFLAGFVVIFAFLLNLVLNFNAIDALLINSGPLGRALDAFLRALTNGLAQLLNLLLGGIISSIHISGHVSLQKPHVVVCPPAHPNCAQPHAIHPQVAPFWTTLALILFQVVALVIIIGGAFLILQRLLTMNRALATTSPDEERESLAAQTLLAAQLRDLFRRRSHPAPASEPLIPGSPRALYRDVLRAAEGRGIGRSPSETPDEYARRLGQTASSIVNATGDAADLPALSDAYIAARYGEREPSPATLTTLRERASRLVSQLTGRQRNAP